MSSQDHHTEDLRAATLAARSSISMNNDPNQAPKMASFEVVTSGLRFPEGPVAMPDGSVLVVEIAGKTLVRVDPDGSKDIVAELGGGPNGAAIGPDGRCYVCNNGGLNWEEVDGRTLPGLAPSDYDHGWIDVVDLATGKSEVLYSACGDLPLRGPNDLVFDRFGGFWFTDVGKVFRNSRDRGGVFYARADGSYIKRKIFPLETANGIGISPDDDILYVAESSAGRLWAFELTGPGEFRRGSGPVPWERGRLVAGMATYSHFDSLAVEAGGNVCVANIPGEITVISPEGAIVEHVRTPDVFTTNICFGGSDMQTAYVTLSSTGQLVKMRWPRPGAALHWLNKRVGAIA
jgi:gluconolactonase